MISNLAKLQTISAPFGANGNSGSGGGGTTNPDRNIIVKADQGIINNAAGGFFRQEAIIQLSDYGTDGLTLQSTWFRSFHQGLSSGYRWILPAPTLSRYNLGDKGLFTKLERNFLLPSEEVYEETLNNMNLLGTSDEVSGWINGYDFDLEMEVVEQYLERGWSFIGSQVISTRIDGNAFYRFVNAEPLMVSYWQKDDTIQYPLAITGSTINKKVEKSIAVRLYIVTDYKLKDENPLGLNVTAKGFVDFDIGTEFVTVIEGTLTTSQMQSDLTIGVDRTKMAYE